MITYDVQYVLEPDEPVAVSDWKEHCRLVKLPNNHGPNVEQLIIDKIQPQVSAPFILLDYWPVNAD